jgi:hypothetical protein
MLIKNVTVLVGNGCDRITITLENKDAFPNMSYDTVIRIDAQDGVGVKWCKDHIGINPDVISAKRGGIGKGDVSINIRKGDVLIDRHIEFTKRT